SENKDRRRSVGRPNAGILLMGEVWSEFKAIVTRLLCRASGRLRSEAGLAVLRKYNSGPAFMWCFGNTSAFGKEKRPSGRANADASGTSDDANWRNLLPEQDRYLAKRLCFRHNA
ncbi:hypothetical protein N9D38_10845, partial [Rubripirellula sp.]|nr:hypothetical protein [Rubripirellula sp.]